MGGNDVVGGHDCHIVRRQPLREAQARFSTQTTQAIVRIRMLYQLQNRHRALESRSLLPSSNTNAHTTPPTVRARSVAKVLSSGHCTSEVETFHDETLTVSGEKMRATTTSSRVRPDVPGLSCRSRVRSSTHVSLRNAMT